MDFLQEFFTVVIYSRKTFYQILRHLVANIQRFPFIVTEITPVYYKNYQYFKKGYEKTRYWYLSDICAKKNIGFFVKTTVHVEYALAELSGTKICGRVFQEKLKIKTAKFWKSGSRTRPDPQIKKMSTNTCGHMWRVWFFS